MRTLRLCLVATAACAVQLLLAGCAQRSPEPVAANAPAAPPSASTDTATSGAVPDANASGSATATAEVATPAPTTEGSTTTVETAAPEPAATEATGPATTNDTDGLWQIKSAVMAGSEVPAAVTDMISLTLSGEDYTAVVGEASDKGTCVVDRSVTPGQMTITGTDGPNKGTTLLAIFDFPEAGTMRVAYDLSGKAFPASFDSTTENGLYVVTYVKQP